MKNLQWIATKEDEGIRLDAFLSQKSGETRSRIQNLIKDGCAAVNGGAPKKAGQPVSAGDAIALDIPDPAPLEAVPVEMDVPIVYEDEDIVVVNKPRNLVTHPAAGHAQDTLVNALLFACDDLSGIGGKLRPGIVHRLDKDTSGLILIAKNDRAHAHLSEQFKQRTMEKHYRAVAAGSFSEPAGLIDVPIARHPTDRQKMAIVPDGKPSRTEWHVLEPLCGATHLDVHLLTGRTHQIRVHMQSIGHPLLGDRIYAPHLKTAVHIPRLMLHAYSLSFTHPSTGERMTFTAPLPPAYEQILKKLASASM